ncbi:PIG-U-domain-containing protein [Dichomitus squalens]|uniref:PIG-U-domain-containing protein n=2 Tax=Dichomitus squalens TaxID=114155 RepID=A0A4Q9NJP8_9APHY|nr:PIG-U-domain-containing protein [Dichomitus squalens LYAD-421 SS1]EJF61100.1 PIG-U-domain-containing protein [Dichomitus squalens LYAD-421 SS1]TBU39466.1 PIG-U-domain-containing protein [Dichomitus squalens]TBU54658.1 PIG-U-domain-containing protein [Dichomitus squalens]
MDDPSLLALVAVRVALAFAPVPETFKYDQQLSSPLTAYSRLREGIYLFDHGVDPYSGGSFRHSPLLLSLFSTALPLTRYTSPVLWTAADVLAAWALARIWRLRTGAKYTKRDKQVIALYLFNPYILLPSLALSTSSIENSLTLLSLMFASRGRASASLFVFAILIHISLPSLLLLVPILLLSISRPVSSLTVPHPFAGDPKGALPLLGEFLGYTALLSFASTLVCGNWSWIEKTWGAFITLPDLTPNPGLWWYFFTEMFDHFRPFFLLVFTVHLLIYIAPICIKFQHDMLYAVFLLVGILAVFKPYPTLSDPGLFISMFSLFPETYPYLRHPIVTGLIHLHASLLLPLFNSLWLRQGTGNANFFYASTLVFGMGNGAALLDAVWAGLRVAIGKLDDGYEVVQE